MGIIDTNHNITPHLNALKVAGIDKVIRYIAAGLVGNEKVIKPAEAMAMAAAGIELGLVYEIGGRPSGSAVGARDGNFAAAYAPTVGAPAGAVIWYTMDYDAGPGDYPGALAAFRAFKKACNDAGYKIGCYASGYISDRLAEDGAIDTIGGVPLIWLTDSLGFRGSRASKAAGRYVLLQGLPRITAGIDTDPNWLNAKLADAKMDYVGTFLPWAGKVPAPQDEVGSIAWVQNQLNLKAGAHLDVDGVNGPMTIKAVENFQHDHGLQVDGVVGPMTISALQGLA